MSNNTIIPLISGGVFTGVWEKRDVNSIASVNIFSSTTCSLRVQQAPNTTNVVNDGLFLYDPSAGKIFQQYLMLDYFRIIVTNTSETTQTKLRVNTTLSNILEPVGADINVSLSPATDGVLTYGANGGDTATPVALWVDASGLIQDVNSAANTSVLANLDGCIAANKVAVDIGAVDISGQNVIVSNFAELVTDLSGQHVIVNNFPASQAVTVSGCPPVQMLGSLTQTNAVFLDGAVSDSIAQIGVTDGYLSIGFTGPTAFTNGQSILLSAVSALPQLTGRVYQIFYQVGTGQTLVIHTPDLANAALAYCTGLVQSVRVNPLLCNESGGLLVDISGQDVHVNNFADLVTDLSGQHVVVNNFPAVQDITGTVSVSNLQDASGITVVTDISGQTVLVGNFPADQVTSSQHLNNLNATYAAGAVVGNITIVNSGYGNSGKVNIETSASIVFSVGQQVVIAGATTFPQLNGVRTIAEVANSTVYVIYFSDFVSTNGDDIAETGTISSYGSSPLQTDVSGNLLVNVQGTAAVSGSVSLLAAADPTLCVGTVRLTDVYGQGLVATAGNLMVGISNIYTSNPLHTILDSATGTTLAYSNIALSNTGQVVSAVAATIRQFSAQNSNATNQYIKIYNKSTAATAADTAIFTFLLPTNSGVSYELNHLFSVGISVRATFLPAVADNTAAADYVFTNFTYSV